MLDNHISVKGTSKKKNLIALGTPVDTVKQAASIHKAWGSKCNKAFKNFNKNFQHLKLLEEKGKRLVMPANSSDNSPACKSVAGLKYHMRHVHKN